jgi:hypothetical protein
VVQRMNPANYFVIPNIILRSVVDKYKKETEV